MTIIKMVVTPRQFRRAMAKLPKVLKRQAVLACQDAAEWGEDAVQRTIDRTSPTPDATSEYRKSWRVYKNQHGAVLQNNTIQAWFVEHGRKPGRAPPLAPILRWVQTTMKKGGFIQSRSTLRTIAFRVQRKIALEGTRKREVLKRTMPYIRRKFHSRLRTRIDETRPPR